MAKTEVSTRRRPMEVGMIIETGASHLFQGTPFEQAGEWVGERGKGQHYVLHHPRCPGI